MTSTEPDTAADSVPDIIPRSEHRISRRDIDPDALKVLYRLNRHGHIAYLVGGGVRDLLLGGRPKDFDISTSAHPNQVRKVFSNCRLIGRRFRLAHIYFKGGKIIEVSTFRTLSEFNLEDGPIRSDNTFGTPVEDAFRRDFTVNALFYNIADFSIIDYVGGMNDLKARTIRTIGDPVVRFQEDPIRILRGVRFAALLDFSLDTETARAVTAMRDTVWDGAVPRILEEVNRMLARGASRRAMDLMHHLGLVETLFPRLHGHIMKEGLDEYTDILSRLDRAFHRGKEVSTATALASLFYPCFRYRASRTEDRDHVKLAREVLAPMAERLQIPRKIQDTMRQTMAAQHRLFALKGKRYKPRTMLRKSYFDNALSLFEIVAGGTDEGRQLIREWQNLGQGRTEPPPESKPRRRPPRRRRRRPNRT